MPGPNVPDTWTISHILTTVQQAIGEFDLPGRLLPTWRFPQQTIVAARIIPVIADLQAIRKVAGFLSHSANSFCSFCKCLKDDIDDLAHNTWHLRTGMEVRYQAEQWRNAMTITAKETLARANGVRWTPLHDLPYWNPVTHVLLGFMHNFLEGILQHQLRALWGIGRSKKQAAAGDPDEMLSISAVAESQSELEGLGEEEIDANQTGSETGLTELMANITTRSLHSDTDTEMRSSDDEDTAQSTPTAAFHLYDPADITDSDDDEYLPTGTTMFNFTDTQLAQIRECIQSVVLPTCVQRPPRNLGEASHGKLKAHELLILFSTIFPLILPEIWWSNDSSHLLTSFCHLVIATNIISAYSTSDEDADTYTYHYTQYRQSIQELFPDFGSMPNHHYAMHNGDLLKFWGPLALLSEFPGERLNGNFGKMKTNRRLGIYSI